MKNRRPSLLIFVLSLLICLNSALGQEIDSKWATSVGIGIPPFCLFSDSGMGTNENFVGRTYCSAGIYGAVFSPYYMIFVKGGRGVLSASDGKYENDKFVEGLGQILHLNSIVIGKEFEVEQAPEIRIALGLGMFDGASKETRDYAIANNDVLTTVESFRLSGTAIYVHLRARIYDNGQNQFHITAYMFQFKTQKTSIDHLKYSMTTMPAAEFSWIVLI
jgi:hypothetical protein